MRFQDVTSNEYDVLNKVIDKSIEFDGYKELNIKLIFDTKAKKKNGKYIFAYIKPVDDLNYYLMTDDAKYLIFLNIDLWNELEDIDKERLLRHETRHILVDHSKSKPYKLRPHTWETFREEVEEEKDSGDVFWMDRLAEIADAMYNSENNENE